MLCLVLDWLDRNRNVDHPLSFETGARWFSQGLLPSRFLPTARVDSKAEAYTHADGVIGHFDINPDKRGDITLQSGARQFVVIEAKLGSGLSAGTRNAPTFDQSCPKCRLYGAHNALRMLSIHSSLGGSSCILCHCTG